MKLFYHSFIGVFIILIVIPVCGQSNANYIGNIETNNKVKTAFKNIADKNIRYTSPLDSIAPDQTYMRNITSLELSKEMIPGWNVGNSLEAIGGETAWGNPKISQQLIDSIKAAGFNSVRIPVAWSNFSDTATFNIKESWLDRVEEVVNYVLNKGMYAIIKEHWDNGWIVPTYAKQDSVTKQLAAMWKQIAIRFRDYDDHLLFAGTNEVMYPGDYGTPKKEYYTVQNSYNQTFVNTVRSTGGRNYYRHLLVQGFNTNINYTYSYFVIPSDVVDKRLIVEVHYYDPWEFTIREDNIITQWGKYATDSKKTVTYANESYADAQFNKMKTKYVDKGYGVVVGEYGAISRLNLGSDAFNNEYAGYRSYYVNYITASIIKHGLVPMYWDNGGTGNYAFGIFNRLTGVTEYQDILKAINDAVDTTEVMTSMINENHKPEMFTLMQNYPNPFNPVTTISYSLQKSGSVTMKIYDIMGREILTVLENEIKTEGTHKEVINASFLSSGVYIYKLVADDFSQTKKMVFLK